MIKRYEYNNKCDCYGMDEDKDGERPDNSDYATALEKIIEECCDDYYKESTKTVKQIVEEIQRLNATHFAQSQWKDIPKKP
jgi:hypothetical protein